MSSSDNFCDPSIGSYGYVPNQAAGIVFAILFGAITIFSLWSTIRHRLWYISFACGGILETLGWGARVGAHADVCNSSLFIMQITCLIIAPAFYSAAVYIILGILIRRTPRDFSLLSPRTYIIVFCSIDFLSLLLQAIGGGIASSSNTVEGSDNGSHIMVAGIFVQLAGMAIFVVLGALFIFTARRNHATFDMRVLFVLVLDSALIFLRNIYRAVELLGGWEGHLNTTENFVIGLDGVPMVICMFSFLYLIIIDGPSSGLLDRKITHESTRLTDPEKTVEQERQSQVGSEAASDQAR